MPEREWKKPFAELKAFRQQHGHCKVPPAWPVNRALARWVVQQRFHYHHLPLDRLRRLFDLGFHFGGQERHWLAMYFRLVAFHNRRGHCNVPARWRRDAVLGGWVFVQRAQQRRRRLEPRRVHLLAKLGFDWDPLASIWEKRFHELEKFVGRYGHCNVPNRWTENRPLAVWVGNMRGRKHWLSPKQIQRLDKLGFEWKRYSAAWERRFQQLLAYRRTCGHCRVPARWSPNPQLGMWVSLQRERRQEGTLHAEQKRHLDEIGFDWYPHQSAWDERYKQLSVFRAKHGHCRVRVDWAQNPALGRWVAWHREGVVPVSAERRKRLDALGFDWDPIGKLWGRHFRKLEAFKREYGHCRVPAQWPCNPALGVWVQAQRRRLRRGRLSAEHKRQLDQVGFDWNPRQTVWTTRLEELLQFRKRFGHGNVPVHWSGNEKLANWAHHLRYVKSRLPRDQVRQLNRLGFRWGLRRSTRRT